MRRSLGDCLFIDNVMDNGAMNRRQSVCAIAGTLVALTLGGCYPFSERHYRFRVTVQVDTPQGLRTGSSVMQINAAPQFQIGDSPSIAVGLVGEAVAVDLPTGTLFMLIRDYKNFSGLNDTTRVFVPGLGSGRALLSAVDALWNEGDSGRTVELPSERYPMMVRFVDPARPETVEIVDPDDLAASFGVGVRLRGVTVTITRHPVTKYIFQRLKWLSPPREMGFDESGPMNDPPKPVQMLRHSFMYSGAER